MIDIRKLEIFLNLTKTMNYSETAEQLFTTQGNISKQIISLEKELNSKLIDRGHRTIKLTSSGEIVADYAAKILTEFNEMNDQLRQNNNNVDNLLTIEAVPSVSNYRGLELITAFHELHPEIMLNFHEIEGNRVMDSLYNGKKGIIFGRDFGEKKDKFNSVVIEEDSFVCIVPTDHSLANYRTIPLSELANEDFLLLGEETALYDRVLALTKKAGFEPHVIFAGRQFKSILNMVAKGMGISIVMEKSVDLPDDGSIVMRPLDISEKSQMLFMKNNNVEQTKAADLFWEFIQKN